MIECRARAIPPRNQAIMSEVKKEPCGKLMNEAAPVGAIHFVPGTPRIFMGGLSWYF